MLFHDNHYLQPHSSKLQKSTIIDKNPQKSTKIVKNQQKSTKFDKINKNTEIKSNTVPRQPLPSTSQ